MRSSRWLPPVAAVLSGLAFLLTADSLTDDAYITLDYAKNLAVHGEWALIPGHTANTATSPLNVGLIGFFTLLTRVSGSAHTIIALGVVNVLAGAVLGWGWARLRLPVAAILLVLANPLVLSAVGLEVLLIPAVLILLVVFADEGRPVAFGVAAGLTLLTRLDLIVFLPLIGIALGARLARALGPMLLVALPWYAFSWFAFGSAVPDTLVIKQLQRSFGGAGYFATGFDQMWGTDLKTVLTFLPAELGTIALVAWLVSGRFGPFGGLGAGGLAYYAMYSLLGVPPYHWYYVPPVVALTIAGTGIVSETLSPQRVAGGVRKSPRWAVFAFALVPLLVAGYLPAFTGRGVPWTSPPFFGNWASATDYARVGRELRARIDGAPVGAPGEIGTIAYFCDCAIIDGFSDRGLLGPEIDKRIAEAGPVMRPLLKVDYARFDRSRPPVRLAYQLRYGPGPGEWTVYSAAKGVGHFTLETVS
ncbi:hypothetical protein [Amycolatopsis pigmentata]|uniref:Dolichyl-phosphate-mannose-protein mannosyltransferase n=1 Tax=Amycolatopsis pigmentata TaxID=450801 RepID=A0ABW5FT37_9PSEU